MRFLWLHGFASGPSSSKGQYVKARLAERGLTLEVPDLNLPSFRELTLTRMLESLPVEGPLTLFGSSLGGYTAALYAAKNPGLVTSLVLLAPAFDLAARWEKRMGASDVALWRAQGSFPFDHYALGGQHELGVGFLEDALQHEPFPLPQCPTLVIQGAKDAVVDPALAREFVRRMEGRATLVELDQGHELNADLPGLWKLLEPYVPRPMPK